MQAFQDLKRNFREAGTLCDMPGHGASFVEIVQLQTLIVPV